MSEDIAAMGATCLDDAANRDAGYAPRHHACLRGDGRFSSSWRTMAKFGEQSVDGSTGSLIPDNLPMSGRWARIGLRPDI